MTSGVDMRPKSTCAIVGFVVFVVAILMNVFRKRSALIWHGPIYMLPVRDGRVEFWRTDAPGISDGMTVEEFSRALRALLTATR